MKILGRRIQPRTVLVWGGLLTPFVLLLILIIALNLPYWCFERDFAALSHPAQSQIVERVIHKSGGDGRDEDFYAAELRSFSGNPQAIKNFYHSTRISVPYDPSNPNEVDKSGSLPLTVEFLPSPLPPNYHFWYYYGPEWDLPRFSGQRNLYIVSC